MAEEKTAVSVRDNPERHRYEAIKGHGESDRGPDGEPAVVGFLDYSVQGRLIVLNHTEVDPASKGQGIGSVLVRGAFDDIRRKGLRAVPVCPFVRAWVDRNPDYSDVVSGSTDGPATP